MVHTFQNVSFEFPDGLGAQFTSEIVAPFLLLDGDLLILNVAGTSVTLTFAAADGVSAAAAVAAITGQSVLITADVVTDGAGDHVRLTSAVPGANAELEVLGGRAQSAFAFPRGLFYGVTYPGAPWTWALTTVSAAFEGMEFDDVQQIDTEGFTFGWGITYNTAVFDAQLFTVGGVFSFTESYNGHQPGWENSPRTTNPAVPVTFVGTGTTEPFDHFGTPAPTFVSAPFVGGSTELFDDHFGTPSATYNTETFAHSLAYTTEAFDNVEPGVIRTFDWLFGNNFQITIDGIALFNVTWSEVVAGADPGLELLYAQQLMKARIETASDLVAVHAVIRATTSFAPNLYLFPEDPTETIAITVSNMTQEDLPRLADLEEVWQFKDVLSPAGEQTFVGTIINAPFLWGDDTGAVTVTTEGWADDTGTIPGGQVWS